jgi:hypothetical protein
LPVGLLIAYTAGADISRLIEHSPLIYVIAMFILYTVAPILYRLASSAYFNLSLLTSDFFGLLFGAHMTADSLKHD